MGILLIPVVGDTHLAQHLLRPCRGLPAGELVVVADYLGDLIAYCEDWVQRGHGVLKDHRDLVPPDAAHLRLAGPPLLPVQRGREPLAVEDDLPLDHPAHPLRKEPHDAQSDGGLSRPGLAHQAQGLPPPDAKGDVIGCLHNALLGLVVDDQILYGQEVPLCGGAAGSS